jgi:glycerophosphoryl diester phosphodiesterase
MWHVTRPLVYAHRGGAALRPENTIAAFDHGLAVGADGLELDVHLARDGTVVVHHDDTLERTTNGRGALRRLTAEELGRLDAGYWFQAIDADGGGPADVEYPCRGLAGGVPTLREVLRRYPEIPLIIELKVNDPELACRTIDELRATHSVDRAVLGSFYWRVLRAAREYEPAIRTGAAREETRWALYRSWVHWPLGRTPYHEFQVPERSGMTTIVTPQFIAHAQRAGLPVKVWTVNDAEDMARLLRWGAAALISDRPDVAASVRANILRGGSAGLS